MNSNALSAANAAYLCKRAVSDLEVTRAPAEDIPEVPAQNVFFPDRLVSGARSSDNGRAAHLAVNARDDARRQRIKKQIARIKSDIGKEDPRDKSTAGHLVPSLNERLTFAEKEGPVSTGMDVPNPLYALKLSDKPVLASTKPQSARPSTKEDVAAFAGREGGKAQLDAKQGAQRNQAKARAEYASSQVNAAQEAAAGKAAAEAQRLERVAALKNMLIVRMGGANTAGSTAAGAGAGALLGGGIGALAAGKKKRGVGAALGAAGGAALGGVAGYASSQYIQNLLNQAQTK